MLLDTAVGPVDASQLAVEVLVQDIASGRLTTTRYLLGEQVVKIDQQLTVIEAVEGGGIATSLF